jgi:hypothetical protein
MPELLAIRVHRNRMCGNQRHDELPVRIQELLIKVAQLFFCGDVDSAFATSTPTREQTFATQV